MVESIKQEIKLSKYQVKGVKLFAVNINLKILATTFQYTCTYEVEPAHPKKRNKQVLTYNTETSIIYMRAIKNEDAYKWNLNVMSTI